MKRIQGIALLILITVVSSASILAYQGFYTLNKEENKTPLNHLDGLKDVLKLIPTDYESLWKQVKEHESKGLPKSALEVVQTIYKKAKEEGNKGNFLKSVIHIMKYNVYLVEDDYVVALDDLNKIALESEEPMKQFVHSMTAEIYWGYYSANRWKFQNRTFTTDFKNEDIRTWDLTNISDRVFKHYLLSVKNPSILKNQNLKDFEEVIYDYGYSDKQRPTLYDFLAHRAIDFFMSTEPDISKPAYTFTLDNPLFFGTSEEFSKLDIATRDSMSTKFYATKIFQDLTAFHLDDASPEAIIDLELKRLNFVKTYYNGDGADSLHYAALEKLYAKFEKHEAVSEVIYAMANWHSVNASKYQPSEANNKYKDEYKIALKLCEEAIAKFPNSFGSSQCKSLRTTINTKSVYVTSEQIAVPDKPSQFLISSKNLSKLHFRIVKLDWEFERKDDRDQEELMKKLIAMTPIKSWEQDLQDDGDHHQHQYELDLPALPMGYYVILASDNKDFSLKDNAIAYANVGVSNLSYTYRRNGDETYDVQVFHRESGEPLANVKAQIYFREYNYTLRKYQIKNGESYTTDETGKFTVKSTSDYRYFYIDLQKGSDRMNTLYSFYQYKHYEYDDTRYSTQFFTDRGIYRPGQTIYFKGMRIKSKGEDERTLVTNTPVTVTLYDVNYQKVASLDLQTNEYGTFSGTFTAPVGVLNGSMHFTDGYGTKYIRVEEYKRPKFEVTFNKVEGTYKLGEKIKVKGLAKSYAGSVVDGAKVKYRVVRSASFPYWCYWRWGYRPYSRSLEVTHGEMVSDENGNFEIEFESVEDKSVSRRYYPTYTYTVFADVTDINGETHSSQQYVRVGRNAMELSIWLPENFNVEDAGKLKVNTVNLNGTKVTASGTVTIFKIKNPDKIYRDRILSRPDRHSLTKADFDAKFPFDEYADENDQTKWPKDKQVLSLNFNTEKNDSVDFAELKNAEPGIYVMEAKCKDAFGESVEDIRYFTIFDTKSKKVPGKKPFWMQEIKTTCEPGEKAQILLGTSWDNCKVLYETEYHGKIVDRKWITLNNEQTLIEIPVEEKHRGNFAVHFTYVKNNRHYVTYSTITVPRTDKELDIEFSTFRNKLLPGEKEEWKITLKGKKGDKVAAEMLMTMYDASLDVFASNNFWLSIYNNYYATLNWNSAGFSSASGSLYQKDWNEYSYATYRYYDYLNWHGYSTYYYGYRYNNYYYDDYEGEERSGISGGKGENKKSKDKVASPSTVSADISEKEEMDEISKNVEAGNASMDGDDNRRQDVAGGERDGKRLETKTGEANLSDVKARTNLNETAFFYPHLESNENGELVVKFTVPEALTKWKILGLAHTKDLRYGMVTKDLITQKELMVMPNMPRFFREGDKITLVTKISNISEGDLEGTAQLMLFDALTMKPVDDQFNLKNTQVKFTAKKGQSAPVSWSVEVPQGIGAVTYRVVAKAGNFSDGEETAVPVLTNRMLVTESMPLPIRKAGTKTFTFQKLIDSKKSSTLRNHKLTLEMTSNPAWYAIQALPYMIEYPYECSEQIFTRFYANSIASHIVNSSPKIKNVFESWKSSSPDAFLSNLEKNQELKYVMLEETPWVLDAQNESERKKRVALLFDLNRMDNELAVALKKLKKAQVSNGGWPWFAGMPDSRWVTQYIVTGMGHLDKLGIKNIREDNSTWNMVKDAVRYCDNRIVEDYKWIKKHYPDYKTEQHISYFEVQYLYARSFFMDLEIKGDVKEAVDYYKAQMKEYWLKFNLKGKGMIAMASHRMEMKTLATDVMKSLKEYLLSSEELGMYFKENVTGYFWYEQPIEVQALMIEAFDEVTNDQTTVEELKVWLLKQKQTTDWKTTTATAEACYSLLLRGVAILENDEIVEVKLDDMVVDPKKLDVKMEAGTGYYKTSWSGDAIKPEWGNITVSKKSDGVSWGALYWQYFEDLDKITFAETNLKLTKKLMLVTNGDAGVSMSPITEKTILSPGDKVRVYIELRTDRDMEYVHMKDMRASCFEPVNVISQYKWQDGLGYYECTKDAATNFFIEYLRKGTYRFEYTLLVSHTGNFSNGITTIQCMYAPEFTAHSEGIRVTVKGK